MSSGISLAQHVVDRARPASFGSQDERMTKADFLDFVWFDVMPCDVLDAFVGPAQTVNVHRRSL